ncbi:MAG: Ribosomal RNA large subunit methyltransferase I [bacterium]|nr:Ribosomal RNA large subunit methyltransferase I [bacterium]
MTGNIPNLFLSPSARKRRARLHPWIFSNEIEHSLEVEPGSLVHARFRDGKECWTAYYNPRSLIAARVLAAGEIFIDTAWMEERLRAALAHRESLRLNREAVRLVHGEADGLPGLIVDRYGPVVVLQSLTAGMDRLLPMVAEVLDSLLAPDCLYARCDSEARSLEGIDLFRRELSGALPGPVTVDCHGIRFEVDVAEGQKTGLFLDQMENIQALGWFAGGADVLDACCYTGAFAVTLARLGAASVEAFDSGEAAILQARRNAELNAVRQARFSRANVFERLPELVRDRREFDIVNLDPPAFAKRKKDVENALRGYRELNRRAFRLVRGGGLLCTSACSHNVTEAAFLDMLVLAARDAGRSAKLIEIRGQAADHPPLLSAPETRYLTCVVLRVG